MVAGFPLRIGSILQPANLQRKAGESIGICTAPFLVRFHGGRLTHDCRILINSHHARVRRRSMFPEELRGQKNIPLQYLKGFHYTQGF